MNTSGKSTTTDTAATVLDVTTQSVAGGAGRCGSRLRWHWAPART